MLFSLAERPKYTEFTIRRMRAESDGSRRMISAIWELRLLSERTRSLRAWFIDWSEASFGHPSIRRLISSSVKGVCAVGACKVVSMGM